MRSFLLACSAFALHAGRSAAAHLAHSRAAPLVHSRAGLLARSSRGLARSRLTSSDVRYDAGAAEKKWQAYWAEHETFKTVRRPGAPKKYVLDMFPYPSGAGLHVGHPEGYTASDIMARYWRMCGYDVLHPMGWDSFGLPAEQHAVQTGTHPRTTTAANIANFKRQLKALGFSYDWSRELATTDIEYVKWTQWIFLQLFKKGLAVQSEVPVNWCAGLGTVLANEEVINGKSERGDFPVERLPLRQWVLKITEYADKLADGLESLEGSWPEGTRSAQRQWIGRSEGAAIVFELLGDAAKSAAAALAAAAQDPTALGAAAQGGAGADVTPRLEVFTTRPDTLFGVTYVVVAPEHPLLAALTTAEKRSEVEAYVTAAKAKSDLDRVAAGAEKTGAPTGASVRHPLTGEALPVWVSDYVIGTYGTGAVMAVPAHDERDYAFARKFNLPIKRVIEGAAGAASAAALEGAAVAAAAVAGKGAVAAAATAVAETVKEEAAFTEDGILVNSGAYDGLSSAEARKALTAALAAKGMGSERVNYKLRDWVFSRQRYWGEPIPIYFPVEMAEGVPEGSDPKTHAHRICYESPMAVEESELPIALPELDDFSPGDSPEGCLARAADWRYFQRDGKWFARETNTMPQWAGSCWYYLRFVDPANAKEAWSKEAAEAWLPVDLYVGGAEHAVLHLLYARFWHKALYDAGLVPTPEPFDRLVHQGMILGSDGEKMSKSRGNVVNPDDIVAEYGADAMRMYEMFMGPLEAVKPWQTSQISGVVRFRDRVAGVVARAVAEKPGGEAKMGDETLRMMHQTIKKVTLDVDQLGFNTAISAMMVFSNHLASLETIPREPAEVLVKLVSPFAPHLGEEMWQQLGHANSLAYEQWPQYDEALTVSNTVTLGIQVNGKTRGELTLSVEATEDEARELAAKVESVAKFVDGKTVKKFIYRPGKIINFVVGN